MALRIDEDAFARGHDAFLAYMHEMSVDGMPFTSFNHDFLQKDEISYKHRVHSQAIEILQLAPWATWKKTPGRILAAVKAACAPKVSANLLEQRQRGVVVQPG